MFKDSNLCYCKELSEYMKSDEKIGIYTELPQWK